MLPRRPDVGAAMIAHRAKHAWLWVVEGHVIRKTAERETEIQIRKDHAYGWQPTVVACPGDLIGYQRRVEEIANRLRVQFALRE
jgi:hypothetical protein